MAGYFDGKKISTVYLGTTLIYKEEVEEKEPMFLIDSKLVDRGVRSLFIIRKDGTSEKSKVGMPFYKGDTLRAVIYDESLKFNKAPTYIPMDTSTGAKLSFEIKVSDQEYRTKFPKGYNGGADFPTTRA